MLKEDVLPGNGAMYCGKLRIVSFSKDSSISYCMLWMLKESLSALFDRGCYDFFVSVRIDVHPLGFIDIACASAYFIHTACGHPLCRMVYCT